MDSGNNYPEQIENTPRHVAPLSATAAGGTAKTILGVLSLVAGIISFLISLVPCLGFYGFFPAVIGLGLGITGLALSSGRGQKGMLITGIAFSALGVGVAVYQYRDFRKGMKFFGSEWKDQIRESRRRADSISSYYEPKYDSVQSYRYDDTSSVRPVENSSRKEK